MNIARWDIHSQHESEVLERQQSSRYTSANFVRRSFIFSLMPKKGLSKEEYPA